jgi:serine/threonine protein kinase
MQYLMDKGIIHRDLSLRNLLVTTDEKGRYVVKVADFGLSRKLTKNYYKSDDKNIPIKWSSPEVIQIEVIKMMTHICSLGIGIWKLFI